MMVFGAIAFSVASGSLASLMKNYDSSQADYQEKLVVLNKIHKEHKLPLDLYIKIKKSLGYEVQKNIKDLTKFINELPHNL